MNGLTLKLIAIITMFIDHATALLIPYGTDLYFIGRSIGRLAFPIFCFLLVEGLLHTRNVKNYLIRLGIFAILSEIPFDMAFNKGEIWKGKFNDQNVFFTLFIGLLVVYLMRIIQQKYVPYNVMTILLSGIVVIIGCQAANFLKTDYGYIGILMIVSFYLLRNYKIYLLISIFLLNVTMNMIQGLATVSLLFIWLYNGERGPKINKYIFYAFYPVHLLVLFWIKMSF